MNGINAVIKETPQSTLCEGTRRPERQPSPDYWTSIPQTCENYISVVYKPRSAQYFLIAA